VTPATWDDPPFPVQAVVVEEDTWRLLSAPTRVPETREQPVRLFTAAIDDRPATPGSVLRRGRRWLAIVHDIERLPTCDAAWVTRALSRVWRLAAQRHCLALAVPLLGSVHRGLDWETSLRLITDSLVASPPPQGLRIWLQTPAPLLVEIGQVLEVADEACGRI
jgi:hypothetical protein